jgi:tetratricopeptide (TPR) repeat protein
MAKTMTAHHDYGWLLIAARQFEDGLDEIRQAQRLEPLSPRTAVDLAWAFLRTGRYADAIEQSRRALDLEPSYLDAEACLELALALDGRPAEALSIARHLLERSAPAVDAGIEVGDPARSLARVRSIRLGRLETEPFVGRVGPYMIGAQHAVLEHRDQALAWLERAYVERAPMMVLLGLDPAFASLHGDERFASLVDRIARK